MWIELHESARQHPKVLRLSRDLDVTWPTALGYVCALWTWTLTMAPDGNLSSFEPEDVEFGCGWDGEPGRLFECFVARRLIDMDGGCPTVHDWSEFAGSLKAAERKRRSRRKTGHRTVTGQSRDADKKRVTVTEKRPTDRPTDQTERADPRAREPDSFDTNPPPPPRDPVFLVTAEHEAAIHRLRDHHAKLHGIQPRGFLTNREDLERIAKTLDEYGESGCRRIIDGHKRLCDQGKESKTGFVFAFPWDKDHRTEPNWDWVAEHAAARRSKKAHTPSEVDETPEQRFRRQQAEEAALTPEQRERRARKAREASKRLAEMRGEAGDG